MGVAGEADYLREFSYADPATPNLGATERALWRLDSAGTATGTIALDGVPTDLALDGERVWVSLRAD